MKAIVYKSTGSWYTVKNESGRFFPARIKGALKLEDFTSTNPVVVGDLVEVEPESEGASNLVIKEILPRNNYINRQSPRHKHQRHIVAANLGQCMLIATLKEPRTSQGFIDRFLVASEMYHVRSLIVFNKSDIYGEKEMAKLEALKTMYEEVGYPVVVVSVAEKKNIDRLRAMLAGKITLVSGHSGVGKSSLLNILLPEADLKTGEISGWSGKGQHTTTFAEMYDLPEGGSIIDTPGMKEFGIVDLSRQELSHYFPEMREILIGCQFNNCLHVNEPGCAVREAVINGEIYEERYASYVMILESLEGKKY